MKKLFALMLALALSLSAASALAEAVDAQALRKQALDAGMKLPEPAEGEALYLGMKDVTYTQQTRLFLAFLASPNRRSIRAAVLYGQAIEVPRPGRDPWLINNQLTLKEDVWIPLDISSPTGILIDEEYHTALGSLLVAEDHASCTEVLSGHFTSPEADVDSDWNVASFITLENITGETAMNPIDPPSIEEARAAGMRLPEPAQGEALYLGAANVSQAGALYVAFVLSEDEASVRGLTVYMKDMELEYRLGNSRVHTTSSTRTSVFDNALVVGETVGAGDLTLERFTLDGGGADAVLKYTFHADGDDVDYPFDPAWVRFQRVE